MTPPRGDAGAARARILLVEPDPGDAELVQIWLRSARETRYDVWHVETLGDAEGCLAKAEFALALVDLALSDAPGPWAVQSLRERHPDLPVIVFSSFAEAEQGARLVAEGALDHLVKGQMSGDVLIRAMRYGVEHGRLVRALRRAEAEAAEAEDYRERLGAQLAQELRTPIHTVLGMADLLLETELTREQEGYVRSFLRASETLLTRVEGLVGNEVAGRGDARSEETSVPGPASPAALPELRILAVHGDAATREAWVRSVRSASHAGEGAGDTKLAEALFRDGEYDLVLVDGAPGGEGLAAARSIRRVEAGEGRTPAPILAVGEPDGVDAALDAGCDAHLSRPLSSEALLAAIARHAPKHHGRLLKVDGGSVEEIDLYLHERHNDLAALRFAMDGEDFDAVLSVARDLERSGLSQGFEELAALGRGLQRAASEREVSAVERGVADLGDFLREVKIIVG